MLKLIAYVTREPARRRVIRLPYGTTLWRAPALEFVEVWHASLNRKTMLLKLHVAGVHEGLYYATGMYLGHGVTHVCLGHAHEAVERGEMSAVAAFWMTAFAMTRSDVDAAHHEFEERRQKKRGCLTREDWHSWTRLDACDRVVYRGSEEEARDDER